MWPDKVALLSKVRKKKPECLGPLRQGTVVQCFSCDGTVWKCVSLIFNPRLCRCEFHLKHRANKHGKNLTLNPVDYHN